MKIVLVHPNARRVIAKRGLDRFMTPVLTPLGIASIAAYERRLGHEVLLIDAHAENLPDQEVLRRIRSFGARITGFSLPIEADGSARIALALKRLDPATVTVVGGVIPSIMPALLLERYSVFDYAVIGEGELPFHDLVTAIAENAGMSAVRGIAFRSAATVQVTPRSEYIADLDSLPFPARDLLPNGRYGLYGKGPLALLEASRGCFGNCRFCAIGGMFGNRLRKKSYVRVVDEIEECVRNYHINFFGFADSTFTADKAYVYSLAGEIIRRGLQHIRWRCVTRVDCVDPALLSAMWSAGCREVGFGVEFIRQDALNFFRKGIAVKNVELAFRMARAARISPFALMILNQYDADTARTWKETLAFLRRIGAEHIIIRPLVVYPGTDLHADLKGKGVLADDDYAPFFRGEHLESVFMGFSALVGLMNAMYAAFYLRLGYMSVLVKNIPRWRIWHWIRDGAGNGKRTDD